jgi:hypothetical protein
MRLIEEAFKLVEEAKISPDGSVSVSVFAALAPDKYVVVYKNPTNIKGGAKKSFELGRFDSSEKATNFANDFIKKHGIKSPL